MAYKSCNGKVTFYSSAVLGMALIIKKRIETYINYKLVKLWYKLPLKDLWLVYMEYWAKDCYMMWVIHRCYNETCICVFCRTTRWAEDQKSQHGTTTKAGKQRERRPSRDSFLQGARESSGMGWNARSACGVQQAWEILCQSNHVGWKQQLRYVK